MNRKTLNIIYIFLLGVELIACYVWLINPIAPTVLALLQGTYDVHLSSMNDLVSSVTKVGLQIIAFSLLFVITTKLYKYMANSLPKEESDDETCT